MPTKTLPVIAEVSSHRSTKVVHLLVVAHVVIRKMVFNHPHDLIGFFNRQPILEQLVVGNVVVFPQTSGIQLMTVKGIVMATFGFELDNLARRLASVMEQERQIRDDVSLIRHRHEFCNLVKFGANHFGMDCHRFFTVPRRIFLGFCHRLPKGRGLFEMLNKRCERKNFLHGFSSI